VLIDDRLLEGSCTLRGGIGICALDPGTCG